MATQQQLQAISKCQTKDMDRVNKCHRRAMDKVKECSQTQAMSNHLSNSMDNTNRVHLILKALSLDNMDILDKDNSCHRCSTAKDSTGLKDSSVKNSMDRKETNRCLIMDHQERTMFPQTLLTPSNTRTKLVAEEAETTARNHHLVVISKRPSLAVVFNLAI